MAKVKLCQHYSPFTVYIYQTTLDQLKLVKLETNLRLHITIASLSGIPGKLCRDVFAAFKWFHGDTNHVSQVTTTASVDPVMDFVTCIECPITAELIVYLQTTPLEISVFGNVPSSSLKTLPHEVLSLEDKQNRAKSLNIGDDDNDDAVGILQKTVAKLKDLLHTADMRLEMQEKILVENSLELEHQHLEMNAMRKDFVKTQVERDQLSDLVTKLQKTNRNLKESLESHVVGMANESSSVSMTMVDGIIDNNKTQREAINVGMQTDDGAELLVRHFSPLAPLSSKTKKRKKKNRCTSAAAVPESERLSQYAVTDEEGDDTGSSGMDAEPEVVPLLSLPIPPVVPTAHETTLNEKQEIENVQDEEKPVRKSVVEKHHEQEKPVRKSVAEKHETLPISAVAKKSTAKVHVLNELQGSTSQSQVPNMDSHQQLDREPSTHLEPVTKKPKEKDKCNLM